MPRYGTAILVLLLLWPAAPAADEPKEKTPADQYQALARKYEDAVKVYRKAAREATTQEELDKINAEQYPDPAKYGQRFLQLAEKYPDDPAAIDALTWVVQHPARGQVGKESARARALDVLLKDYARSDRIGPVCMVLGFYDVPTDEAFLRAVLEKNANHDVQGLATMALALKLKNAAEMGKQVKDHPGLQKQYEKVFGADVLKELMARDPNKLATEMEQLFQRVVDKYADVKYVRGTVGNAAEAELFEIQKLAIGKPVPDIEASDADGKSYKLSDYRGKVVVLDFWATWCGPCVSMIPHEKELVERLHGKPFALIGINVDQEKETLKSFQEKRKLSWPSLWDPATDEDSGPIAGKWNVQAFPTIYIVDAKGVIRHKYIGVPEEGAIDDAVDALVKEAESAGKKTPQ
jgi:thiol-disulfide isomerase/thioredoxin